MSVHEEPKFDEPSGDDPMSGAKATRRATLCEGAETARSWADLGKLEASKLIDDLKARLGH